MIRMNTLSDPPAPFWRWLPYLLLCLPLVFLVANCVRDAYCDLDMIRTTALRSELARLRSQALRRAGRLETLVEVHSAVEMPWSQLRQEPWLQGFWSKINIGEHHELYAAITDPTGEVVQHTDPEIVGTRLGHDWYDHRESAAGQDVLFSERNPLAGSSAAFDLAVPLVVAGKWIGNYREGLDSRWFASSIARQQRQVLLGWFWVLAATLVVSAAAVWGLVQVISRQRSLQSSFQQGVRERARQLGQLGAGLAHEIRNPLHALRINLHTLKRALTTRTPLSPQEVAATVHESDVEIDRLNSLLQDLLQFTSPSPGERGTLDVSREMQATLNLLSEDFRRQQIKVESDLTPQPVVVPLDPIRLRQIIVNLLTFAQHNTGKDGVIEVQVVPNGSQVELAVADGGPTLTEEQQTRLFEPFQAPAPTGSGLGLALVRCFAEAVGGAVSCERRNPTGNRVRVWLPLSGVERSGGHS
jgi:two-component system sensor histidine kinase HydH